MLNGKHIAILATDGFEQSELEVPLKTLREVGAEVCVVSLEPGSIRGATGKEWGGEVEVDVTVDAVSAMDFDALVIPGGLYNPDALRRNEAAVSLVRAVFDARKPVAAICHGPWLLIEAEVVKGRRVTSYPSIKTDLVNAGALWTNEEVVCHQGLVTSRSPADLKVFCDKIIEEIGEGIHEQRVTAVG